MNEIDTRINSILDTFHTLNPNFTPEMIDAIDTIRDDAHADPHFHLGFDDRTPIDFILAKPDLELALRLIPSVYAEYTESQS